jgi:RNA polymerase sigma-70 factor, ECF subfamily
MRLNLERAIPGERRRTFHFQFSSGILTFMPDTSLTLLDRLRRSDQPEAWTRFVRLYAPLLLRWASYQGFSEADAEDLTQTVLIKLIRLLPSYARREGQSFRGWLFTICKNECRDFRSRRATRALPKADGLSGVMDDTPDENLSESEYRSQLVQRALELVRADFSFSTWEAFTRFVLEGKPAADVARELCISSNAVYLARNRILTRVREELKELLD